MKYAIDPELKSMARLKVPGIPALFPAMNLILSLSRCGSDKAVTVSRHETPGYQGARITTCVITPRRAAGRLPCVVFLHGGGFMLKASGAHHRLAKMYAEGLPCRVIYPDYRLAPRFRYPVPAEDCFQTYAWVLANAAKLDIDPDKIVIVGDSAGGNLALVVTLMARDRGLRLPRAALLIYPATDRRMLTGSMKKYVDTPVWDARLSRMMWRAYLGDQPAERIEYASPAEAASFADFPPTYLEVAEYDALHDEGVALHDRLQKQGIACEIHEVAGACHGFEVAQRSRIFRDCMDRRMAWLKRVLNEGVS